MLTVLEIFEKQKNFVKQNSFPPISERKVQLNQLKDWILNHRGRIEKAIYADFSKPFEETDLSEIYPVISEINFAFKNLKSWTKFKKVPKSIPLLFHKSYTRFEPKGVVLIISPWNYPFQLCISPLVSTIAAGNSVILKPSEYSKNTSKLIAEMVHELFTPEKVSVVLGDGNIANKLVNLPFDHIFFTGSTRIGQIVAEAAAKNFTSTTLELGGKSPVIIDENANLDLAAEKIVWGKFLNSGQSCIAPDYIFVNKKVTDLLASKLVGKIKSLYGKTDIENNSDFSRIISSKHYGRLKNLLFESIKNGSTTVSGGKSIDEENFIEPTIVKVTSFDEPLLKEEIFGPILPLIEYNDISEVINWVVKNDPPLAIYIFSNDKKVINKIVNNTQSGGVGINEVILQFNQKYLPFGGVKQSGIGKSHGFAGFKSFSNERSYIKAGRFNFNRIIYPPFTDFKRSVIDFLIKYL